MQVVLSEHTDPIQHVLDAKRTNGLPDVRSKFMKSDRPKVRNGSGYTVLAEKFLAIVVPGALRDPLPNVTDRCDLVTERSSIVRAAFGCRKDSHTKPSPITCSITSGNS